MVKKAQGYYGRNYYITLALKRNKYFIHDIVKLRDEKIDKYSALEKRFEEILSKYLGQDIRIDQGFLDFMYNLAIRHKEDSIYYVASLRLKSIIRPQVVSPGYYLQLFSHTSLEDINKHWKNIQRQIQENSDEVAEEYPEIKWSKTRKQENKLAIEVMYLYDKGKRELLGPIRERSKIAITKWIKQNLPKRYKTTSIAAIKDCIKEFSYLKGYFFEGDKDNP